jgi:multiple sugar transport system permease protein
MGIKERQYPYLLISPVILILFVITIYPIFYAIYLSFRSVSIVSPMANRFIGFNNYIDALLDPLTWKSLINTIQFVGAAVGMEFFIGTLIAIVLFKIKNNNSIKLLILIPMMLTPSVTALIWRLMYNPDLGIINYFLNSFGIKDIQWLADKNLAIISIIIVDCWQWIPFIAILMLAGLESIPKEPYEIAVVDGASSWQIFRFITLPLLKPTILIILLFRVLDSFKIFEPIYILTDGGPGFRTEVFSLWVYRNSFKFFKLGYGSALSIIMLFIAIVISQIFIKNIKRAREIAS